MNVSRRAAIATGGMIMLGLAGCLGETKDIPDGMSEAAFDMGAETYDLLRRYLDGKDGYNTTGHKISESVNNHSNGLNTYDTDKPDGKMFLLCSSIGFNMQELTEDDKSEESVKLYLDGIGCLLETGDYSQWFKDVFEK